jgi:hypothetical protein
MSVEARIEALERKHKHLHDRIESLEAERAPDTYIVPLKREKLAIKDEISQLRELHND